MTPIAVIPVKGTSRRLPFKNWRLFYSRPIFTYSIEAARLSGLFDRIVVATDEPEVTRIAERYGAGFWTRPAYLSADRYGPLDVVGQALWSLGYGPRDDEDFICCILATAPLMQAGDLVRGYRMLCHHPEASFIYAASRTPLRDHDITHDAGQWYWGRARCLIRGYPAAQAVPCTLPDRQVCDINTLEDWGRAEQMYAKIHAADGVIA